MTADHRKHPLRRRSPWRLSFSGSLLVSLLLGVGQAQVTLDGSLGARTPLNGPAYTVPAAVGQIRGGNLFHSFGKFNIRTGESLTFTGPDTIANILSRVTGGQSSSIDGLLRSEIPGANVYLLNPNGVLFGPNARLDVLGSFHVSTADFLRLGDDGVFHTSLAGKSVLTVAPPAAFGFLRAPAAVTLQGSQLQVPSGATMSLVGGDLTIAGDPAAPAEAPTLGVPSGQLHLVSVAAPGEVRLPLGASAPRLDVTSFARLGTITLTDAARLDTSGEGGGSIVIRGGRLRVESGSMVANTLGDVDGAKPGIDLHVTGDVALTHGSVIQTTTMGTGNAGDIRLRAGSVQMDNAALLGSEAFAMGRAGDVMLDADSVTIRGGAQIESRTFGPGAGGEVTVRATGVLLLEGTDPVTGFPGGIFADTQGQEAGAGAAGTLRVQAGSITVRGGAQISGITLGPGQGGDVLVTAAGALLLEGADSTNRFPSGIFASAEGEAPGAGAAGTLRVQAGSITIRAGAFIDGGTFGPGAGGEVTVRAAETLLLEGSNPVNGFPSGIFTETSGQEAGAGAAGTLRVEAGSLTVRAGAVISSATFGPGAGGNVTVTAEALTLEGVNAVDGFPGGIFIDAVGRDVGAGAAGTLRVEAGSVTVRGGAQISGSTFGLGQGGDVTVTATGALLLEGVDPTKRFSSGIFASTGALLVEGSEAVQGAGAGAAGTLRVQAGSITLRDGALIRGSTFGLGQGGDVTVRATEALTLEGTNTGIFASTEGQGAGAGTAGTLRVEAGSVAISGGAQVSASTLGPGQGGMVSVTTTDTVVITGEQSSLLTTARGSGRGGDILLQAPLLTLADGASITAESTGPADAGTIRLTVTERFLSENSTITTAARLADGGNIQVRAKALVRLRDSSITATVGGGAETVGGNIAIDPEFVILEGSQILAEAFQGKGGNIGITAGVVLINPSSHISASSVLGIDGTVDIQAPIANVSSFVAPLPQTFGQEAALSRHLCAERWRGSPASSFVLSGRDSVPATPSGVLPSLLYEAPLGTADTVQTRVAEEVLARSPSPRLRLDNTGHLQLRGGYPQRFPQLILNVECAK